MSHKQSEFQAQIDQFARHYDYDTRYMHDLLQSSLAGYEKFDAVMPLVQHRERLDVDTFWVARLAAMKVGDCGDCLQLTVKMALECGVDKSIVNSVIHSPDQLSEALRDVYIFATAVAAHAPEDDVSHRIESRFDTGQRLELGLCIATTLFFPLLRRAAGYSDQCNLLDIAV